MVQNNFLKSSILVKNKQISGFLSLSVQTLY